MRTWRRHRFPTGKLLCWLAIPISLFGVTHHVRGQSLAEALDTPNLVWVSSGDAVWTGQTLTAHDGEDAAVSGVVGDGQQSVLETTVNGPGLVSFWWRVSSETNWDALEFSVGTAAQSRISGETDWRPFSAAVPTGTHVLRWVYAKDAECCAAGEDRGWLDGVAYTEVPADRLARLAIRALIDGRSRLVLREQEIYWDHLDNARPGLWPPPENQPTRLDAIDWYPVWPDDATHGTARSQALSLFTMDLRSPVLLTNVSARGTVRILQQPDEANDRTCVIEFDDNAYGSSDYFEVTVLFDTADTPPLILEQPTGYAAAEGETVVLRVLAHGARPLDFQWRRDGVAIDGATASSLTLPNVQSAQAGSYDVVLSNLLGIVTSQVAVLSVASAPVIVSQPRHQAVAPGGQATFTVHAVGTPPLDYQWYRDGTVPVLGATNRLLVLDDVQATQAGAYHVVVSNPRGSTSSSATGLDLVTKIGGWPGWGRGGLENVEVVGSLAYAAQKGGGFAIYDIGNPTNITRLGGDRPGWWVTDVKVDSTWAFVTDFYFGLYAYDVSDPANPVLVGSLGTGFPSRSIHLEGSYAYVAGGESGLVVVDITDPTQLRQIGAYDTPGEARGVCVTNGVAYVADGAAGIAVISVSDPAAPVLLGSYLTAGEACDIKVAGGRAYVAAASGGLELLDVTDPSTIAQVDLYDSPGEARRVHLDGAQLFLADGWSGLHLFDVSNPDSLQWVSRYEYSGVIEGVALAGHLAYVAHSSGLLVVSYSSPSLPRLRGMFNSDGSSVDVAVAGTVAYLPDQRNGLRILDVSNPRSPQLLSTFATVGDANRLDVADGRAFVTMGWAGLQVVDVSDPLHPTTLGLYPAREGDTSDVQVDGNIAYVTCVGHLLTLDVSNPGNIVLLSSNTTPQAATRVKVVGNRAYVSAWDDGLLVLDVSNPAQVTRIASFDTPGSAWGVNARDNLAFVADSYGGGLHVLDVGHVPQVSRLGGYDTPGDCSSVELAGNLAYVADGWNLAVLDITDPSDVRYAGAFDMAGWASEVKVVGNLVYVADGAFGLTLFEINRGMAGARPAFSAIERLPDGGWRLTLTGSANGVLELQSSPDLLSWATEATLTNNTGTVQHTVPPAPGQPQLFFRARKVR